jgi:hypothetical protein
VTLLTYAGHGRWSREEDFWAVPRAHAATEEYAKARAEHDPGHAQKMTRLDWGTGPEWARGGRSYAERPRVS